MNSQIAKADRGKPKLTLVPRQILFDIAAVREYGNKKYPDGGPDNWKRVEIQRYRDAAFRHFMAYLDDPYGVDEESGLPHLWHLACNIAFLCELERSMIHERKVQGIGKENLGSDVPYRSGDETDRCRDLAESHHVGPRKPGQGWKVLRDLLLHVAVFFQRSGDSERLQQQV